MPIFNSYTDIILPKSIPVPSLPIIPTVLSQKEKNDQAFASLKAKMWAALKGTLDPAIYVMGADCGTGKSKVGQAVLKEWKATGFAGNGGAVVFVNTLAEVDAYKDRAGLGHADYAVLSPDLTYRAYGAGLAAAGEVPILFVTHAKARKLLSGLPLFADATDLLFCGKPRGLRIWEEAFLPVEYASFELNGLRSLPEALKGRTRSEVELIERLLPDRSDLIGGNAIDIPTDVIDVADAVLKAGMKLPEGPRLALGALSKLAGSKGYLTTDESGVWRIIGTGRPMPADMGPLFVLDASARLTNRYDDLSAYGMDVVRLDPALIRYKALRIHWWNKGAGKTALRNANEKETIFRAIAELIGSKPEEEFLIVLSKECCRFEDDKPHRPDTLEALLGDAKRVAVTTWGRHLGNNDYRKIPNVILVGSWNYDNSAYDAISLAVTGKEGGIVTAEQRRAAKAGEFAHNVYQAICRCSVRNAVGADCSPANAYLIMADSLDRRCQIEKAFPECSIEDWKPIPSKAESKSDKVIAALLGLLETRMMVTFQEVREACGSG